MDILSLIPVSLCNSFQKHDRNSLSRSNMISSGRLFSQYQCWKNNSVKCSAVSVVVVGMSLMSDPSQLVNVIRLLYPLSSGSGPTKSIATESHQLSGTCQDLAGSWYARCEWGSCGCKGSVVQWFCGSEEGVVAQKRQR